MTAATTERSTEKKAFSLGIATYALAWAGVLVFLHRVFGMDVAAIILSLVLVVPLVVAVQMRRRWPEVRKHELAYLLILMAFVLGGSVYTIHYWADIGLHNKHTSYLRFQELTVNAQKDPAFNDVEFSASEFKVDWDIFQIRGTVASQADLERLKSLCDQYGFSSYAKDVVVSGDDNRASGQ